MGFDSGSVSAFDVGTGEKLWTVNASNTTVSCTVGFQNDSMVAVVAKEGLLALNSSTGNVVWQVDAAGFDPAYAALTTESTDTMFVVAGAYPGFQGYVTAIRLS